MEKEYDYVIVGSGLYGATWAYLARNAGKKCLILEKEDHIGGCLYTPFENGIPVHKHGAHIFHTDNAEVWKLVKSITDFNNFINTPIAIYKKDGEERKFHLPFNMNTFSEMWGVETADEAKNIIEEQRYIGEIKNLEDQARSLVGDDIFKYLIEGYTEKQWGRKCSELPADIIKRLPVRFEFNNNYFNDSFQGVPEKGYSSLIGGLIGDCEVILDTDYNEDRAKWDKLADKVIYTGPIDEFFTEFTLEWRTLTWKNEWVNKKLEQEVAVYNYTSDEQPYTRVIEHKHFHPSCEGFNADKTLLSYEYPKEYKAGDVKYYPVNNERSATILETLEILKKDYPHVHFGGRLAEYKYYDMDDVIAKCLEDFKKINK